MAQSRSGKHSNSLKKKFYSVVPDINYSKNSLKYRLLALVRFELFLNEKAIKIVIFNYHHIPYLPGNSLGMRRGGLIIEKISEKGGGEEK